MQFSRKSCYVGLLGLILLLSAATLFAADPIPDFAFIHASDVHAPSSTSADVISEIAELGEIELVPYGVTVPKPSFVVVSGDLTEFGAGAWDAYLSYWNDVTIPVYHQLGNHDGPWFSVRGRLRELHGSHYWSFDEFGCHFIGLNTASPQDPRATISREEFLWLEWDLKQLSPETPVFLVMHHPLNDSYFGSPYAVAQLIDMLRPHNLVAVLGGHGHNAKVQHLLGIDTTDAGATCGPLPRCKAGFSIVSVLDGTLRIAFKEMGDDAAARAILEKPLPARSSYLGIEILSPRNRSVRRFSSVVVRARISGNPQPIVGATWRADRASFAEDESAEHAMEFVSGEYRAVIPHSDWAPGAHYLRVTFTDQAGGRYQKSVSFYVEPRGRRLLWRTFLDGSCRWSPAVTEDTVYVGGTDGKLYALRKSNGKVKWTFSAEDEIAAQPLVVGDTIYAGSADGKLYALGTDGSPKWTFEAEEAVYCPPVFADGLVLFGSNDSDFYAVDAETGDLKWACEEPACAIESKPFVDVDTVYFGAWDTHVYAVDVRTGELKWKCVGHGSADKSPGVAKYYSPADAGPVASEGKVFIADRHYTLSIIDAATGDIVDAKDKCAAVGLSEDGRAVYLRRTGGELTKIALDGSEIWSVPASTDSVPSAPVEKDGVVYSVSRLGLVQAFDAADGSALWEYRATPMLYVLSEVAVADGAVYVSGMDGSVTALGAQ